VTKTNWPFDPKPFKARLTTACNRRTHEVWKHCFCIILTKNTTFDLTCGIWEIVFSKMGTLETHISHEKYCSVESCSKTNFWINDFSNSIHLVRSKVVPFERMSLEVSLGKKSLYESTAKTGMPQKIKISKNHYAIFFPVS